MQNKRQLPARYIPLEEIDLHGLRISAGGRVVTIDNWSREFYTGSLIAIEEGVNGLLDNEPVAKQEI